MRAAVASSRWARDALRAFASQRDSVIALHPAVAESVALTEDTEGVSFDSAAKTQLAALRKARSMKPRLPRSFHGTLREYQQEGSRWLARLCGRRPRRVLADDVGLGKTVQSLALLCPRHKEGPALAVCPTSVAANWQDECAHLAPKLRIVTLEASGRAETVPGLLGSKSQFDERLGRPRSAALHADGHRCLVFTQFLGCIARLGERLSDLGLEVFPLDGSTPAVLRKARIDAFQRGEADAFVMSLKPGGVGINLTAQRNT